MKVDKRFHDLRWSEVQLSEALRPVKKVSTLPFSITETLIKYFEQKGWFCERCQEFHNYTNIRNVFVAPQPIMGTSDFIAFIANVIHQQQTVNKLKAFYCKNLATDRVPALMNYIQQYFPIDLTYTDYNRQTECQSNNTEIFKTKIKKILDAENGRTYYKWIGEIPDEVGYISHSGMAMLVINIRNQTIKTYRLSLRYIENYMNYFPLGRSPIPDMQVTYESNLTEFMLQHPIAQRSPQIRYPQTVECKDLLITLPEARRGEPLKAGTILLKRGN